MSQDQADQLAQWRSRLSETGPAIGDPLDALRLLALLDAEADELLTRARDNQQRGPGLDQIAEHRRRRAYVWVRLAEAHREFEETATAAVRAWRDAEADVIRATVETAGTR